jgi:osmotically-inducible protein OsmY
MKTDSQLQQDVQAELRWEPSVDAAHIGVTAKNGVVTLTGHVPYYSQKRAAESATERVSGVKGIAEEIQTSLSDFSKHTDPDIAEAAITAMRWNTLVPNEKIQVKVENGMVTLLGDVDWNYQREAAKRTVENLTGVKWISNEVNVKPHASPVQVEDHIKKSFERNAQLDANMIKVEAHGGEVILKGTVRSMAESRDATTAAWGAPGVSLVTNQLHIA